MNAKERFLQNFNCTPIFNVTLNVLEKPRINLNDVSLADIYITTYTNNENTKLNLVIPYVRENNKRLKEFFKILHRQLFPNNKDFVVLFDDEDRCRITIPNYTDKVKKTMIKLLKNTKNYIQNDMFDKLIGDVESSGDGEVVIQGVWAFTPFTDIVASIYWFVQWWHIGDPTVEEFGNRDIDYEVFLNTLIFKNSLDAFAKFVANNILTNIIQHTENKKEYSIYELLDLTTPNLFSSLRRLLSVVGYEAEEIYNKVTKNALQESAKLAMFLPNIKADNKNIKYFIQELTQPDKIREEVDAKIVKYIDSYTLSKPTSSIPSYTPSHTQASTNIVYRKVLDGFADFLNKINLKANTYAYPTIYTETPKNVEEILNYSPCAYLNDIPLGYVRADHKGNVFIINHQTKNPVTLLAKQILLLRNAIILIRLQNQDEFTPFIAQKKIVSYEFIGSNETSLWITSSEQDMVEFLRRNSWKLTENLIHWYGVETILHKTRLPYRYDSEIRNKIWGKDNFAEDIVDRGTITIKGVKDLGLEGLQGGFVIHYFPLTLHLEPLIFLPITTLILLNLYKNYITSKNESLVEDMLYAIEKAEINIIKNATQVVSQKDKLRTSYRTTVSDENQILSDINACLGTSTRNMQTLLDEDLGSTIYLNYVKKLIENT